MKIKKLEFSGHEVLGDLRIDFTDESGKPLDVVVFIGDNGTGKTKILETIVKMIEDDWSRRKSLYEGYQVAYSDEKNGKKRISHSKFGYDFITYTEDKDSTILTESYEESEYTNESSTNIEIHNFDLPMIFDIYRHESSSLKPEVIWMPAELDMDKNNQALEKKRKNCIITNANEWSLDDISDYIVKRINGALSRAIAENDNRTIKIVHDEECKQINSIFKILELNVKLTGLSTDIEQVPLFENKEGKKVKLKQLSAGEKQLFFRLLSLKNLNVNNAIIIVDEPETSLHPEWQRKIIKVYEEIGKNNQIIIATHSPLIVGSVPTESVRILSRNTVGEIEVHLADQTYGKSVEEIMSGVMDLNSLRDEATAKKIADVIKLLEDDKYDTEEYKSLMADLKKQLGATDKDIMLIEMEKTIRMRQHATSK